MDFPTQNFSLNLRQLGAQDFNVNENRMFTVFEKLVGARNWLIYLIFNLVFSKPHDLLGPDLLRIGNNGRKVLHALKNTRPTRTKQNKILLKNFELYYFLYC